MNNPFAAHAQNLILQLTPSDHNGYNISCFGGSDGVVNLTIYNGVAPFEIHWSNGATTEDLTGVPEGYYHVEVSDYNGSTAGAEITLTEAPMFEGHVTLNKGVYPNGFNTSCHFCTDGSIATSVEGGIAPHTFQWTDGAITQDRTNISAGDYEVIVSDANGCTVSEHTSINAPGRDDWTMSGNSNSDPATQFIGTSDNKDFVFRTNSIEKMRLKSNGELKINSLSGTDMQLIYAGSDGTLYRCCNIPAPSPWMNNGNAAISSHFIGTTNNIPFIVRTNNFERLRVSETGNVGIGMVATTYPLEVAGTMDATNYKIGGNPIESINYWSKTGNDLSYSGGNVGIGTGSVPPTELVQFGDRFVFHNGGTKILGRNFKYTTQPERMIANEAVSLISFGAGGSISFEVGPAGPIGQPVSLTNAITIANNGTVGIGTDPTANAANYYKLVVGGKLGANEIWCSTGSPWPDYVFEKNYTLKPLDELEAYLKEKKHLPGMLSAKEIEQNGKLNITETIIQQQEKLEEAYLYIFELKKEIDELKKEIKNK